MTLKAQQSRENIHWAVICVGLELKKEYPLKKPFEMLLE